MSKFKLQFLRKEEVAKNTMAFHFKKPDDFTFEAGQFADYIMSNPKETDEEGNVRGFSFVHAPCEDDIVIATRMRDTAFKRCLKDIDANLDISIDGPYGSFTLHKNTKKPAVFVSGGIGITPMRSMIIQATNDKTDHKIFLFYANDTPQTTAFFDDFKNAEKENKNFKFIPSMTRMPAGDTSWKGETGFFTQGIFEKYVGDLSLPIYYVSGPAGMVKSIKETLIGAGVDEDNIRFEEFSGY